MKRSRTIGVAAILSAALTSGCNAIIDATAGIPMPEANSSGGAAGAGGQGGATGSGGIGGSGGMGGQGGAVAPVACVLEVCVLDKASPTAECQAKSILEYGSMTPGMDAVRLVRINNPCEDDAALTSAAINGFGPDFDQAFKSTLLQYDEDPVTPGVFQRIERPLPAKLPAQSTLYAEVSLHAPFVPGPLPDGHLIVGTQLNNAPGDDIDIPIVGDITNCDAGTGDCDGSPQTACETDLLTSVDHCGECGAVCSLPNANQKCGESGCEVGSCINGYVDLDTVIANGCECKITNADDLPDDSFVDSNCDGIDGTEAKAIFVAPTSAGGNDANAGTKTKPVASITVAIQKAIAGGKTQILVSSGTYSGRVTLTNGLFLAGGYLTGSNFTWVRSAMNPRPVIESTSDQDGVRIAVYGENLTSSTVVDRMSIRTTNTSGAGVSNYAMYVKNGSGLTLKNSDLIAGNAGPGINGIAGTIGAAGGNGQVGLPGVCGTQYNPEHGGAGGLGGTSQCEMTGGNGGQGGGDGPSAGGKGGSGAGGTMGGMGGNYGDPGGAGQSGQNGMSGLSGTNGAGGNSGGLQAGTHFWLGASGVSGGTGGHGRGGGGGGGGGGEEICFICTAEEGAGNGGGGGGGGGCGGEGGAGGLAGGGSFGLFLVNSGTMLINNNAIKSGIGGTGGSGGVGGAGGAGGTGAAGASFCTQEVGAGGHGGYGGNGAKGGAGGGGAGGPSYAIYKYMTSPQLTGTNLLVAGSPGTGGTSPGNPGANGASGQMN